MRAFLVDNRYRIRMRIGNHAVGAIHHAVDEKTGTHVLIKRLSVRTVSDLWGRDLVLARKYYLLAQSAGPNILFKSPYDVRVRLAKSEIPIRCSFLPSCVSHEKAFEPILLSTKVESELQVVGVTVACHKHGTPSRPDYALYQTVARSLIKAIAYWRGDEQ